MKLSQIFAEELFFQVFMKMYEYFVQLFGDIKDK